MININLDYGIKEIMINNDPNKVIKFNAQDYNIVVRLNEAYKNIETKLNELDNLKANPDGSLDIDTMTKALEKADIIIKEQIDYIFNANVSEIVFGNLNTLTTAGGKYIVENFLDAIMPEVMESVKAEAELSQKKIAKHTDKYNKLSPKAQENFDKLIENTTKELEE